MFQTGDSWDIFWDKYDFDEKLDRVILNQEQHSVRWRKIEKQVQNRFGGFRGLKVIEIGSGRGEISALMALKGAEVTLIDSSRLALEKANKLFANLRQRPNLIQADILDLPRELKASFDISMSFGVAEHFTYPSRKKVIKAHADVLKSQGISFIAVPNRFCLPYRFFMILSEMLGYSDRIIEIPFSRKELKTVAVDAGFRSCRIAGSSFMRDSAYFLFTRYISHLFKWKLIIDTSLFEVPLPIDDYFGYSLVLIATK